MAINYATKYHSKVAERFKKGSITNAAAGNEYSFVGAKTIVISSVDVVPLNDFDREAGSNRFGAVTNLGDTKQEMQMTQDKSFVFAIDAGDNSDQAIDKAAGKALRRQIDEVVNPHVDKYRLGKWAEGGVEIKSGSTSALTKSTILSAIIKAGGEMSNALVPEGNRTLYIPIRNYQLPSYAITTPGRIQSKFTPSLHCSRSASIRLPLPHLISSTLLRCRYFSSTFVKL